MRNWTPTILPSLLPLSTDLGFHEGYNNLRAFVR